MSSSTFMSSSVAAGTSASVSFRNVICCLRPGFASAGVLRGWGLAGRLGAREKRVGPKRRVEGELALVEGGSGRESPSSAPGTCGLAVARPRRQSLQRVLDKIMMGGNQSVVVRNKELTREKEEKKRSIRVLYVAVWLQMPGVLSGRWGCRYMEYQERLYNWGVILAPE